MDRSTEITNTGTLSEWENFFRACQITPAYRQSYAATFIEERVRPHELSTYTKDDYRELGVKLGDRVRKRLDERVLLYHNPCRQSFLIE